MDDYDETTGQQIEREIAVPTHFVGIGASAGGLEALQTLFENMPSDTGVGFIIVQHLSPDFKSVMAELLSKHTDMPVYNVQDGVHVEANTVYLIPPRKNMLIAEGRLLLSDQMPDQGINLPIDIFLRALAEDQQHKAIGIILSGTGSDGSRGVKAIKEAGGLVIVQEPSSAKFDGMPHSAVNTGLADFVLPAEDIPAKLTSYLRHPLISGHEETLRDHISSNEDIMAEVFALLKTKSAIDFAQYKPSTVARRIERRMGINQLTELRAYLSLLLESPKELQTLSKELLIGVTRFFRDEEAFEHLETQVLPKLLSKTSDDDGVRIWVPGCSTGEEAYSLAILLDEAMRKLGLHRHLKIFATDVDGDAIVEASGGRYSEEIVQDVSETRLQRYFVHHGLTYEVKAEIRQMVIFATHNMISDPPFSNIDLVSCRNALIYFQHTIQKKVLAAFHFALRRDGVMFLGSSESLGDLKSHFELLDERCKLFQKISNVRIPLGAPPPLRDPAKLSSVGMSPVSTLIRSHRSQQQQGGLSFVNEKLIGIYVPACIVLNEDLEALHVYGDVSRYIQRMPSGKVTTNIKDIIIDDLSIAVSTALSRAEKSGSPVYYTDVSVKVADVEQVINLRAQFFREKDLSTAPAYYTLVFEPTDRAIGPSDSGESFDASQQSRQRIRDLEHELVKKQEHLQVTIEELETTNEELQSANEELMSANEELQSTNEELQSVNEELYTVNSEFQEKIAQLTMVNDDLDNVLSSTKIGIVFLDEVLLIRKYTQVATSYINLMPADIGRPFHHISHDLDYDDLFGDISKVIQSSYPKKKDVTTLHGRPVTVQIMPYQSSSTTEGLHGSVVIAISDISQERIMESVLGEARARMLESHALDLSQLEKEYIHVLVIDDEPHDRTLLKNQLSNIGDFKVKITDCDKISAAVELATSNDIDICLVDYRLGNETALDFVESCNSRGIKLPTIVLSGYSKSQVDHKLLASDISDFISKDQLSSNLLQHSIQYAISRAMDVDVT